MIEKMETVIPDALQRGALQRRSGISREGKGPGSAARHCMPRRIRDDAKKWSIGIVAIVALAACSTPKTPRAYDRDPALPADLPFSSAVIVGDVIYLSGEIGRNQEGAVVEGGVGAQTRQIFENYKRTLARVDADLSDIVKCTVFLDDMSKFAEMNAAYAEFFPDEKPARSTFGVDGLALGAALEIECLAVRK